MDDMHGPTRSDLVTLVVPQREQLTARVEDTASTWVDLALLESPRTSMPQLERSRLFLQFAGAQGLCRISGELGRRPQDSRLRVVGYGSGEVLRFSHRGNVQLLRRAELVSATTNARIVVLRSGAADHVAVEAKCVELSGAMVRVRGVPFAATGQLFEFDLFLIPREPAVRGQLRVERVGPDGVFDGRLTRIAAHDRGRLVRWAAEHKVRRVA
jgi:hypothetical protein